MNISAIYERKLNSTHYWKQNSLFRVSYVLQCFKRLKYLFEKSQSINCTTQTVYRKKKRNKEKCCNSVNFIIKHYISYTAGNACICDKKVHPIWMKYMGVHHVIWCNVKSHTFYVTKYDKIITWKVLYIWTYLPPNDGVTSFRDQQPQHTACVYDQNLACHTLEAPRCTNTWPLGHKL